MPLGVGLPLALAFVVTQMSQTIIDAQFANFSGTVKGTILFDRNNGG